MKIIIAGSRSFTNEQYMADKLKELFDLGAITEPELICGMAKGADEVGRQIFKKEGLPIHKYPANWKDMSEPCRVKHNAYGQYNALAGMKRNKQMGDVADLLVAFWNGSSTGTKDMIDYMHSLGKPVYVFEYNKE